jgi:hypothetical protein
MAGAVCHFSASSTSTDTRIKYGLRPACFAGFNQASNAIQLQLDKKGIGYRMKDNAFVEIARMNETLIWSLAFIV